MGGSVLYQCHQLPVGGWTAVADVLQKDSMLKLDGEHSQGAFRKALLEFGVVQGPGLVIPVRVR